MDKIGLSLKLKRLAVWLDSRCQPDSLVRKQFHGAPFGSCYVTIDPGLQAPYAFANQNRIYLCGTEAGMESDSVRRLIDLFAAEGVKRFFVWLSPGPDMDVARRWLEQSGLSRIRRTGYPTLCRNGRSPVQFRTDLEIREVSADEIAQAREQLGETIWPEYARSAVGAEPAAMGSAGSGFLVRCARLSLDQPRRDLVCRRCRAGVERDRCRDDSPLALTAKAACPI